MRKKDMDRKAIALSSTGNYEVYRQLWNIDIPQDISNFRQIQEEINKAEKDIEKQRRYFYAKSMVDSQKIEKDLEKGLIVKDFIPTAGIIRVDLGNGEKIDLIANYPFDNLQEGANLQLLGKGYERKEAEFEGELFYTQDLRGKNLSEIKLSKGLSLEEANKVLKAIEKEDALKQLKQKIEDRGIDLSEIDGGDIEEVREVLEALKEEYDNLNGTEKTILRYAGGIEKKEDLNLAITLKDIVDRLQKSKKLEGKIFGYKTEFYPLNGIIVGENNQKELYLAFSPERVEWKELGIGIAKRLDDYEYKLGNSILTIIQNPYTYRLIKQLEYLNRDIDKDLKEEIEEDKKRLIERLRAKQKEMLNAEGKLKFDEKLFEITDRLIKAIEDNNIGGFTRAREELRKWRNEKIWEKVGKQRIDVSDLLKADKKYNSNKKVYFLKWSMDEQRTPLAFYRNLYILTKTDGLKRLNDENLKIYNNDIRLFFGKVPKIIPTDPKQGRKDKGTDLQFIYVFKPHSIVVKNTTLKIEDKPYYNEQIIKLGNSTARKEIENILKNAIEKGQYPSQFIGEVFKKANARIFRNSVREIKNSGFGLYVDTYIKPIEQTTSKLVNELNNMKEAILKGNSEEFEKAKGRYFRFITQGVREDNKYYAGLEWLRDRISKFNQAVVYNTLLRELIEHYKVVLFEKSGLKDLVNGNKNLDDLTEEERKQIAENIEKMAISKEAKNLFNAVRNYENSLKVIENKIAEHVKYENAELSILERLKKGEDLTEKQRRFLQNRTRNMYKNIFVKNLSDSGLYWLIVKVKGERAHIKDDKVKESWERFFDNLNKESKNRLYASQIKENVGIGQSTGLKQLNKIIAIKNALEVKEAKVENLKLNTPNIKVKISDEENLPTIEKELKIAKGNTPLLVEKKEDLENIAKELVKELELKGIKGEIEFKPAYEIEKGVVYGFSLKIKGMDKPIEYKPQMNKIPTLETALNNIDRKLKNYLKEQEKKYGEQVYRKTIEAQSEIAQNRSKEVKSKKQKIDNEAKQDKGRGLDLG